MVIFIMKDQFDRKIDYLRISITDRCNFRCKYCMPDGIPMTAMSELLTYEEIVRLARIVVKLGIRKIKITGGEPLVRRDCCKLIAALKAVEGIEQVTLTTNGYLLDQYIDQLIEAGIDAVNVSLDTLNPEAFYKITGQDVWKKVYENIHALLAKNIRTKINVVSLDTSLYGISDEWKAFVALTKDYPLAVRFIEVMPIGCGKQFATINHADLIEKMKLEYPTLEPYEAPMGNGPAIYYRVKGYKGSIGFISAIHGKFCDACNRVRLTSTGFLKPCLCYQEGTDIKAVLRSGLGDEMVQESIEAAIYRKPKAHAFEELEAISENKWMSEIGG